MKGYYENADNKNNAFVWFNQNKISRFNGDERIINLNREIMRGR